MNTDHAHVMPPMRWLRECWRMLRGYIAVLTVAEQELDMSDALACRTRAMLDEADKGL